MNRETYRKILIAIFTVYLCVFIYYLSVVVYTSKEKTFSAIPAINQEKHPEQEEEIKLMPLGIPVGIYIRAKGVMVLDTGIVTDLDGIKQKPTEDLIKKGDYIVEFNEIANKEDYFVNYSELQEKNAKTKEKMLGKDYKNIKRSR